MCKVICIFCNHGYKVVPRKDIIRINGICPDCLEIEFAKAIAETTEFLDQNLVA